jgi:AmiR/NasT family two-component response regulator
MAIGKLPKVLVAEDNALIAMSLREVLDLFGFDVVGVAASVTDALCLAPIRSPILPSSIFT